MRRMPGLLAGIHPQRLKSNKMLTVRGPMPTCPQASITSLPVVDRPLWSFRFAKTHSVRKRSIAGNDTAAVFELRAISKERSEAPEPQARST
jgi:hypothetical protein